MPIPEEVASRVAETARELADTPEVESFLLGLATESVRESAGLGADAVVDVFRTDDEEEAREVLSHLERELAAHPKRRTLHVDAGTAPLGGLVRVYVALWASPSV